MEKMEKQNSHKLKTQKCIDIKINYFKCVFQPQNYLNFVNKFYRALSSLYKLSVGKFNKLHYASQKKKTNDKFCT